jgi:hypothetical protein
MCAHRNLGEPMPLDQLHRVACCDLLLKGAWMIRCAVLAAAACLLPGCGGDDAALLGSYLELEFDAPLESAASVSLGTFNIPAPTVVKVAGKSRTIWVRIKFELIAETLPSHESSVASALEERRGALNDAVLTIVRTSSTDELTDPRASALRMRIAEAVRPMLGGEKVRQLVLYKYNAEKM